MSDAEPQHRLTLRAIEVFVAVIEEGSFAAGAKRLDASPSSVSQQIANLEEALGARLIERLARPLALTTAGYLFQRRALAILDETASARAELIEMDLAALPELRIATVEDFDLTAIPSLVESLAASRPHCRFSVHSGLSHENVMALESRAVDLVVAAEVETSTDWLEIHPLLREPFILIAARGLLGGSDTLARLAQAPLIRYGPEQMIGRQIESHLRRLRLSPPRGWAFSSTASVVAMTARSGGWALTTPAAFMSLAETPAVEARPLPFQGTSRTISLYARRSALGSLPALAAQTLREEIAAQTVVPALARLPWLADQMQILPAVAGPVEALNPDE
ncbi:MAG: LysR family transcriptional regulator [Rhodospirillales bacterium]